jgi:transposase-like protein
MSRHRSRAEREGIVQRLDQSGLSIAAFARREGLSPYSVRRWSRDAHGAGRSFAEIVLEEHADDVGRLVVETPNGFRVAWDGAVDMKSLTRLVVELAR